MVLLSWLQTTARKTNLRHPKKFATADMAATKFKEHVAMCASSVCLPYGQLHARRTIGKPAAADMHMSDTLNR